MEEHDIWLLQHTIPLPHAPTGPHSSGRQAPARASYGISAPRDWQHGSIPFRSAFLGGSARAGRPDRRRKHSHTHSVLAKVSATSC